MKLFYNTSTITFFLIAITGLLVGTYFRKLDVGISSTPLDVTLTNTSLDVTASTPLDVTLTNTSIETSLDQYEDAFGRLRISDQYTLGDYKHVYFSDENYIDVVTGTATVTFIQAESSVQLNVLTTGDSAIHQTKSYHHYQPGKSQSVKSSFVFGTPTPGVIKRTGLFDSDEGIYLEMNELDFNWTIKNINFTQTINRVDWLDPFNGTGPSGVSLDFTKAQLIFIDFQWLGVGRVRCGFVHDGKLILATEFYHSNVISSPYLRNPSLPVRCQLISTGGAGSMKQVCATVISEGGYAEVGRDFDISTGHVGRICPNPGTKYPLLAIRLKNTFKGLSNRVSVRLSNVVVYMETHGALYELWKVNTAASLSGTVNWLDPNSNSAVEYSVFPTTIDTTGALLVNSGFVPAGNPNRGNTQLSVTDPTRSRQLLLAQNFTSTDSEVFVIVITPLGTGNNVNALGFASMQWREVY